MLSLKNVHVNLKTYLRHFERICSTHNIQYWADGGTLLGAVRENGMIIHDDDIDVCMYESAFEKFKSVIDPEYFIFTTELGLPKFMQRDNKYVWIDILIVEDVQDRVEYKIKQWPTFYYNKHELFPLRQTPFEDILIWIPNHPIPYLERGYGNWQTPAEWLRHEPPEIPNGCASMDSIPAECTRWP